ncbi:MAG TPA: glycosyltransferase family 4 protein [Frankiaceae bacterium]|nr:glycosyltransferase family 4 protein [Frankiaceae bacterium]
MTRVCVIYDCLYPHTIGGAERWLRAVALAAVEQGHEVTYLTRRQWGAEGPSLPGAEVVAVSAGDLYDEAGDRRVLPGVAFAGGVLRHLVGHRRSYDVVHTANFPYFHLYATRLALAGARVPVVVDWHEVLSAAYLDGYLGPVRGPLGRAVQRAAVAATRDAQCFSELTESRLRAAGARRVTRLPGLFPPVAALPPEPAAPAAPHVVYAGRHVADKRVLLLPDVLAALRRTAPDAHATVLGDGPLTGALRARVAALGLAPVVALPGNVPRAEVEHALRGATCLLLPSAREGYGIVVAEAAAHGTPSVVVAGPDNAAVELVVPGVNGLVAPQPDAATVAAAVAEVHARGAVLRASTAAWYAAEAPARELAASVAVVLARYAALTTY